MNAESSYFREVDLTLLVTCYNEKELIVPTLETLLSALEEFDFSWEIVIIDDCSTDNSVDCIEQFLLAHSGLPIQLFVNESNQGFGYNIVEGAFLGRGQYYRTVCGDNADPKETFVEIFKHLGVADIVLPCPIFDESRPWARNAISRLYTTLVNLISGNRLKYYNGHPLFRRFDVMRWHGNYRGFGIQADLLVRLLDVGRSYIELDVRDRGQKHGGSTAFEFKNMLSVAHTLLDLCIMRIGKILESRTHIAGRPATSRRLSSARKLPNGDEALQNTESDIKG